LLFDALVIVGSVCAALLFLVLMTRFSPAPSRKESNDFTGAVVAVIGTTYAVILAFMLSGVWSMFQQAQVNEEQEANNLVTVYRLSSQLPEAEKSRVRQLSRSYAHSMLNSEWPALAKGEVPPEGAKLIDQLWKVVTDVQTKSTSQQVLVAELMAELRAFTEHRQIRIMQSREKLPGILWTVLVTGGIITVTVACFFGVNSIRFHVLQVLVLTFLVSLVLVAIAEIDQPYRGGDVVSPDGFRFAIQIFDEVSKQ
jgi:hypothetical protein